MWPTLVSLWLTLSRPARRRAAARRLACPPALERLEDRTTPSTVRLTPGNFAGVPTNLTSVGSTLYFEVNNAYSITLNQLWRTGGRPGDAVPVDHGSNMVDNRGPANSQDAIGPVRVGTWLYFFTDNGPNGQGIETYTLWRNDSTAGPTSPSQAIQTVSADPSGNGPDGFGAVGHDVYFGASDATEGQWELWKVAGADAPSSTVPAAAPFQYPGADSNGPSGLYPAGSYLYFGADAPGTTNVVLWGSDGTPGGTAPVRDSSGSFFAQPFLDYAAVGSDLYGIANNDDGLWHFSGQSGTEVESNVGNVDSQEYVIPGTGYNMTAVGNSVYFTTLDTIPGQIPQDALWKYTDTDPSAQPVLVYQAPYRGGNPWQIVGVGSDVYVTDFSDPGVPVSHVWKTDGTPGGTGILETFSDPSRYVTHNDISGWLTAAGSTLYFEGADDTLWQSQGSPASTQSTGIQLDPLTAYTITPVSIPSGGPVNSPLAAIGSTLYYSVSDNYPTGGDLWRLNSPPAANSDAYATDQDSTLTVSAAAGVLANDTDPDAADAGYLTAALVTDATHGHVALNADGSFTYTPDAGYYGPDSFTYQASDGIDPSNVATVSLTVQPLQDALGGLATGGTLTVQTTAPDQAHNLIAAANGLNPATTPTCTLVVDLGGQTIQDTTVNVPPQVTVQFTDGTFIGGSPALIVSSGNVVIRNSLFLNSTNAATILVQGGRLTLRNCDLESTGASPEALQATGGTVDLGTSTDPGNNTINISGGGAFALNSTSTPIAAAGDTFTVNGAPLTPSSLSGIVWEDFNDDGQVDFGEKGISGVKVTLTGTDDLGNAMSVSQLTDSDGAYVFLNLRPGTYTLTETQPAGYGQGIDSVGTAGGRLAAADQFFVPLGVEVDGLNYNYGEQPPAGGTVQKGEAAGIGFWNNKNGQALIKALNGGGGSTQLADWLAATLPNTFGKNAGSNNLTGKTNAAVAALFQSDFVMKGVKLDAQVLATALSVYATSATLDPTQAAAKYGFTVSGDGAGTATVSVGSNGDAFGVANNSTLTLMDLLKATDAQAVAGVLYNGNTTKRNEANIVFSAVNQDGGIS